MVPKQPHLSGAELALKTVPFWTHPFRPHFWGQIVSFHFTVQKVIENEEISNLTQGHLRKLHTLELRYSVQLTVEKEVERIVIDGQYEDVLQVFGEILELLHEVEKDKHERNHAEMLSKDIQWKYEEDGTFEDYDGNLNAQIELAFQKDKSKIEIQMDEENYTVKFDTMTMEDEGGVATEVKRIDLRKGTQSKSKRSVLAPKMGPFR